ncbi:CHC2 zinc finger domain-containing protein [Pandoraea captiosa]|uniref:CHC2 zinc finger domain-containing protein n=1 Tax=Pandoraea captiosa TaxID=2508302 RepID=UPI003CCE20D2
MCFNGHDAASPSFTVNKAKNTWRCFGCGEHGDAIASPEAYRPGVHATSPPI